MTGQGTDTTKLDGKMCGQHGTRMDGQYGMDGVDGMEGVRAADRIHILRVHKINTYMFLK